MSRTITRILVPTDFGAASDSALDYAIELAHRFGATLHLLHVVEDPFARGAFGAEAAIPVVPTLRAELVDEAADKLASRLARATSKCVAARSEVRVGRAANIIRDVAEEHGCDLIVMGTHGRCGMAHLLVGSVAERMVRQAPCPVLAIRDAAAAPGEREIGDLADGESIERIA